MKLTNKLKEYLLSESGGKVFPKGLCPRIDDFCKEILEGVRLWPIQKLIIKLAVNQIKILPNIPLTVKEEKTVKEWIENGKNPDRSRDAKYAQAVINYNPQSRSPTVILLVCGRGSGKTFISSILVSYFIRFLISLENAHKFFGLAKIKPIAIQCLAGKESQAISLFRPVKTHVRHCHSLQGTYDEYKESLNFGGVVEARAYTSNADTTRGEDTYCYYHEETAYCGEDTPDSEKSFTQCYKAIQPAVKNRFNQHGVMLFVTSAGMKRGKTWELYNQIKRGVIQNCVMVQLAIWEINPNYTKQDFSQEYAEDRITADAEHGSQFVDSVYTFLTRKEVYSSVRHKAGRLEKGEDSTQYWVHIDPSRKHDRYAVALGHKERYKDEFGSEHIRAVVDHIHYWEAFWEDRNTGERYRPQTAKDKLRGRNVGVNTQEVLTYIHDLCQRFNVMGVTADQFESQYIIEELNDIYGSVEFPFAQIRPITEKSNWLAYRNIKKLMNHGLFKIYNEPAFIEEALVLMRYNKNKPMDDDPEWDEAVTERNPNLIYSVQAPRSGRVTTDDIADAVTFCVWEMMSNPELAPAPVGDVQYTENTLQKDVVDVQASDVLGNNIPQDW